MIFQIFNYPIGIVILGSKLKIKMEFSIYMALKHFLSTFVIFSMTFPDHFASYMC